MTASTSASYPLVRNFKLFSTRAGVRTRPSRPGSSPSSTSSCRMRSCIFVFYIALFAPRLAPAFEIIAAQAPAGASQSHDGDPDALYRERSDIAKAKAAAAIWEARAAADPRDYDSAWKFARATYWLGGHLPQAERRAALERGVEVGRRAAALEPMK